MNRLALFVFSLIGALVLVYTASFYAGSDPLALGITVAIAIAFFVGVAEIVAFDRRLSGLRKEAQALSAEGTGGLSAEGTGGLSAEGAGAKPLAEIPAPLRDHLRGALGLAPPPSLSLTLTPYLVGLLVMLGLLGTFLGLFETLRGAHTALSTSQDIASLRDGLRAPMHGLMRSFGTSAAGVACSAVLGLLAVLARGALGGLAASLRALAQDRFRHEAPAMRQGAALEQLAAQGEALPEAAASLNRLAAEFGGIEAALSRSITSIADSLVKANDESLRGIREGLSGALEAGVSKLAADLREDLSKERASLDEAREAFSARLKELVELFERQEERLGALESKREAEREQRQGALIARMDELISGISARAEASEEAQEARAKALLASMEAAEKGRSERIEREIEAVVRAAEAGAKETIEAIARGERERTSKLDELVSGIDARANEQLERFSAAAREIVEGFREERSSRQAEDAARFEALLESQAGRQAALEAQLRERFEAFADQLSAKAQHDREGLLEASEAFASGVRAENERLLQALEEGEGAKAAQLGEISERLSALLEEGRGLASAQKEASHQMAERLAAEFGALGERLSTRFEGDTRALLDRLAELSSSNAEQLSALVAAHEQAAAAAKEGASSMLSALEGARRAELEALSELTSRLEAMGSAQDERALSLMSALREANAAEREELAALKRSLVELLEEQAHSFGRDLSRHAEELAASLSGTDRSISEAAGAILASGAELGALVEGFSAAVDAHNQGASAWREGLGEVEALIVEAGEGAAAEALSAHLTRTHELFDHQLRFQRELLAELRELSTVGAMNAEASHALDEERDAGE